MHGCWKYLYRAIDRDGALVDVMLSEHRDLAAGRPQRGDRRLSSRTVSLGPSGSPVAVKVPRLPVLMQELPVNEKFIAVGPPGRRYVR